MLLLLLALVAFGSACAAQGDSTSDESGGLTEAVPDFATGPAVLIPDGYEPPTDRVDSTGAYLPVNDAPTLVFLEAIW